MTIEPVVPNTWVNALRMELDASHTRYFGQNPCCLSESKMNWKLAVFGVVGIADTPSGFRTNKFGGVGFALESLVVDPLVLPWAFARKGHIDRITLAVRLVE